MLCSLYAIRLFFLIAVISRVASAPIPIRRNLRPMFIRDDTSSDSDSDSDPDSDSGSNFNSDSDSGSTDNTSVDSDSGSGNSTSTDGANDFAADSSIDVAAILQSVKSATSNPVSGANFETGHDNNKAQIYQLNVDSSAGGSVYAVEADMDVDCDGTDYQCRGNTDGQSETSYGALSAKRVPFYVLPQSFVDKQNIKGNSLGAIICNNRMFFAIMGDTNGASPEVIGEASWLMARTCFPNDGLYGAKGHDQSDVMSRQLVSIVFFLADIVFGNLVPTGINEKSPTIDVSALKELGDKTLKAFKLDES
ncbi:fungal chitosanase of glycosyl hydrolase group 75-domain-containing protein [Lentinula raphanica]|nr:fungal chitosanase of glycosyl hydrolase group 75-domain-containing protein [Lentinula raphanica]